MKQKPYSNGKAYSDFIASKELFILSRHYVEPTYTVASLTQHINTKAESEGIIVPKCLVAQHISKNKVPGYVFSKDGDAHVGVKIGTPGSKIRVMAVEGYLG